MIRVAHALTLLASTALVRADIDESQGAPSGSGFDSGFDGASSIVTPPTGRVGLQRTIDINAASWDVLGDPDNTVLLIDMASLFGFAPGSTMPLFGLGWDLTIETVGASWLSEPTMVFDSPLGGSPDGVFLTPGTGADEPGVGTFQSEGTVKFIDVGLNELILSDGMLRIEFFESFDDVADAIDAHITGTLTLQSWLPSPGSAGVLAVGAALGARRRRAG